jgi:outer membrane lipoprotein-sorting protein
MFKMLMQSTRFQVALYFAICFYPHRVHAQDLSATDLLRKIAETYQHASSFSIVAEKKVVIDTDPGIYSEVVGSHQSHDIKVTLIVSPSSKAKLQLQEDKKEIVVIADGNVVWTSIPAQHVYSEVDSMSSSIQAPLHILQLENSEISGAVLLLEYENLVATRFRKMSYYEPWAKLEPSEIVKAPKEKKECYVLEIEMPKGAKKYKLWVDKSDFTIWKTVETTTTRNLPDPAFQDASVKTTVTLTMEQMILNPALDDSNFVFTPPDRAKKVDSLKLSGSNPFE